jgi:hypothetical protein
MRNLNKRESEMRGGSLLSSLDEHTTGPSGMKYDGLSSSEIPGL